jgi:peptide/nickel transport system permease protein
MVRRFTKRSAPYLLVIWAAISISFALPRLAPGQPIDYLLGYDASGLSASERSRVLAQYGLDRPLVEQYVTYLAGIASGDLGSSVRTGRPVSEMVLGRLGWTLALALPALALGLLVGVPAGAIAAWRRRRASGAAITGVALILGSLPAFWLGLVLVAVFAAGSRSSPRCRCVRRVWVLWSSCRDASRCRC